MFREIIKGAIRLPVVREALFSLPAEVIVRSSETRTLVLRSRQLRLDFEQHEWYKRLASGSAEAVTDTVFTVADIMTEPMFYGLWGPGDVATGIEFLMGREINGRKMDPVGRWMSFIAAAIPVVPSRTIIGSARAVREVLEDSVYKKAVKRGLIWEENV